VMRILHSYKDETISIGGRTFEYSPYSPSGGFQDATFNGGPLCEGDYLRIRFIGCDIVQIERTVRQTDSPGKL